MRSVLLHVIPSAVSYCEVCDGDARVIVMFALRKLIPTLATNYYESHELRSLFLDKVLSHLPIPPLLQDQSPVPQYMIRLLSEISSASPECCQDLVTCCFLDKRSQGRQQQGQSTSPEGNIIQLLFHFLRQETSTSLATDSTPRHDLISSDPQVLILLRQLLSSTSSGASQGLYFLLMKEGICPTLSRSLISSIQSMNSELLLVTLELLLTLLSTSRNELQQHRNDQEGKSHRVTSSILTSLETHFQPLLLPLLGVLLWKPSDQSQDRVDPSVIFILQDCTLKAFLLLIDLIPDLVVESLLQDKHSSSRISRILTNDQVSLPPPLPSPYTLLKSLFLQWDLRLLSKFLNVLLKLLKVPSLLLPLPPLPW
jgi:hypothetical protein